jgi:hypothetical protein
VVERAAALDHVLVEAPALVAGGHAPPRREAAQRPQQVAERGVGREARVDLADRAAQQPKRAVLVVVVARLVEPQRRAQVAHHGWQQRVGDRRARLLLTLDQPGQRGCGIEPCQCRETARQRPLVVGDATGEQPTVRDRELAWRVLPLLLPAEGRHVVVPVEHDVSGEAARLPVRDDERPPPVAAERLDREPERREAAEQPVHAGVVVNPVGAGVERGQRPKSVQRLVRRRALGHRHRVVAQRRAEPVGDGAAEVRAHEVPQALVARPVHVAAHVGAMRLAADDRDLEGRLHRAWSSAGRSSAMRDRVEHGPHIVASVDPREGVESGARASGRAPARPRPASTTTPPPRPRSPAG